MRKRGQTQWGAKMQRAPAVSPEQALSGSGEQMELDGKHRNRLAGLSILVFKGYKPGVHDRGSECSREIEGMLSFHPTISVASVF